VEAVVGQLLQLLLVPLVPLVVQLAVMHSTDRIIDQVLFFSLETIYLLLVDY
jgi:hypothetical protein